MRYRQMEETMVISVSRKPRSSEKVLKGVMIGCAVLFLLQGILFSTGFMLPCFLMVICYYWYSRSCSREYEYTLSDEMLRIERVSDSGRRLLHEIPFQQIRLICRPDAPEAAPYRKGGSTRIRKVDYTSYREDIPYYTVIAEEDGRALKLLLDLNGEAIRMIRRKNREAVRSLPVVL